MITLKDNDIAFSEYVRFIENKDETIIINGRSGIWGVIDKGMLNKVEHCIQSKIPPLQYINALDNKTDRQQLREIFEALLEEKMIKSSKEEEMLDIAEVEFKLTNKCNLKCLHCAASSDISKEDVLTTEQIKIILDKIFKMKIKTLLLTGGEPLLRKDIKVLLTYIRKNFNGTINVITNGTLIDKDMAYLLRECVSAVSISIDGYDKESTEFVRGKGVYDKIMNAISNLKEVGFNKDTLNLTMVSTYQNFDHDDDFNSLCEKLGVSGGIRQFSALGRGLENYDKLGIKDYSLFNTIGTEEIEQARGELNCKIACRAGVGKFMVNEMGDLYPCLILGSEEYKFGSALNQELIDIFTSKEYSEFINKKIISSIVDNIPKCKNCNVRYFCMDKCLGVNNAFYNNKEICEERCKYTKPYLNKILWDDVS